MDAATFALVAVAVGLALLAVVLARASAVLDEAEATLRALVTGVRTTRRAVRGIALLSSEVGAHASAGEAALGRLEELKAPGCGGPRAAG